MPYQKLFKIAAMLLILFLSAVILKFGKPFLVPLTFAALLAMLMHPVCVWFQQKGVNKALSTVFCLLLLISFFAVLFSFVTWQVSDLTKDASDVESRIIQMYEEIQIYIRDTFGVSMSKQKEVVEEQQKSVSGSLSGLITGIVGGLGGLLTNIIIIIVYIFLFLYYRSHIKRFIIRVVPDRDESRAEQIVNRSQGVAQKYLTGLFYMIVILWIMYGIGFSIVGVKNAIFFAILCGVLEIIPFVGNVIGTSITVIMVLIQGGGVTMVLGVLGVYGFIQFVQTYLLEPLVVGAEVNINPLATIIGLIAGEFIWGFPGMVVAIPLMGIVKIICDHIEPLRPFGELIGEEKKKESKGFKKKMEGMAINVKQWFVGK